MLIERHKTLLSSLVLGLYASTLAFASPAAPQSRIDDSQERALLTHLVSAEGNARSSAEYRSESYNLISQYDKTAPGAGRTDRLLKAMTEMGMATAEQAAQTKSVVESLVANEHAAHPELNQMQLGEYSARVTMSQLQSNFLGAQFSGCLGAGIGAGAVLATAILGDVYANSLTQTATTTSSSGSANGTTSTTVDNGSTTTKTTTSVQGGTATTTVTTTNTREQSMLYAVSGILYGVSAGIFIYMMVNSDSGELCGD